MRNSSDIICRENQNTRFMFNFFFPPKILHFMRSKMEKYGRARQATEDNIMERTRFACWINKATDVQAGM